MEATFNVPWEAPASRRGGDPRNSTFQRWMSACRNLARFDGAVRARLLVLFLCTAAAFTITTVGGAAYERYVAPAAWVLTSVADLVMVVGILAFVGKVGRETRTRMWGTVAAASFLVSMAASTASALVALMNVDVILMVAGRAFSPGWAMLVSHLALGIGFLASVKVLTQTAKFLHAAVPLTHARSARTFLSLAIGAVVGTHLIHLFGDPRAEVTAAAFGVSLTLALVAGARLAGSIRHLRDSVEDALDAGQLGMPERWFAGAHAAY